MPGRRSLLTSYLLLLFLGGVGAHRLYNGRTRTGIVQYALTTLGALVAALLLSQVGLCIMSAVGVWVLLDAFLIPGWVREHNDGLAASLSG